MVVHWRRRAGPRARRAALVNGTGAALTGATLAVIVASKLVEGAWISVVCGAALVALFRRARRAHERILEAVSTDEPLDLDDAVPPVVVVPIRRLDQVARKALRLALTLSADVHAVQVLAQGRECEDLARVWEGHVAAPARRRGVAPPRLVQLRTQYREIGDPLLTYVRRVASEDRARFVAVLIPEMVEWRWYHWLLFSHTATALRMMLLFRGGPQVVVVDAPWHLQPRRRRWHRARSAGVVPLEARTAER